MDYRIAPKATVPGISISIQSDHRNRTVGNHHTLDSNRTGHAN